jgi:hypothetical protein
VACGAFDPGAINANKFTDKGTVNMAGRQGQENGGEWIMIAVSYGRAGRQVVPGAFPGFLRSRQQIRQSRHFCRMMGAALHWKRAQPWITYAPAVED